jgi:hypothetical protein
MAHHFVGDRGACGLDADEHEWRDGRLVCPAWLTAPDPAPTTDEEHPMETTGTTATSRQTLAHTLRDHEPDQSLTDGEYWLAEADHVLSSPWMAAHDAMMLEGKEYQLRRSNRIRQNQSAEIERLRQYAPTPAMEALLARSSIGTDEAVAARESVSADAGRAVVRLGEVMRERDEARAVLGAVEALADKIERDCTDRSGYVAPNESVGVLWLLGQLRTRLAPVSGAVAKPDDVTRWDQIADNWTVSAGERFRAEYARETDDAIELTATDEMAGVPVRDLFRGAADSYYTARADALTEGPHPVIQPVPEPQHLDGAVLDEGTCTLCKHERIDHRPGVRMEVSVKACSSPGCPCWYAATEGSDGRQVFP